MPVLTNPDLRPLSLPPARPGPHPLCAKLRDLRKAAGLSLSDFQARFGIAGVVVGSYERGDRVPPLSKLDTILGFYGYRLAIEPVNTHHIRLPEDIATELHAIADQIHNVTRGTDTDA